MLINKKLGGNDMEKVELTRAEIDALNEYAKKVRKETIEAVLADVKAAIIKRHGFEDQKGGLSEDEYDRCRHLYGRNVCEGVLLDVMKIERRYSDETDKV